LQLAGFEPGSLLNLSSENKSKISFDGRITDSIRSNNRGINLLSIQECIFGIRPIQGKMRSSVWTV
jgi:hypothetical protein